MGEKIRSHIRSNVIGYVALFIALSGTAYANHETILSSDIVDGEVKTADIAPNAVTSARINNGAVQSVDVLDNTLTGTDVKESSLGFECPAGYDLAGKDVCYEPEPASAAHANANFDTALSTCAGNGDRLPTLAEGYSVIADLPNPGNFETGQTWTADQSSGVTQASTVTKNFFGAIIRGSTDTSTTIPFRCVTSPHG